jgi:hypothetical protein
MCQNVIIINIIIIISLVIIIIIIIITSICSSLAQRVGRHFRGLLAVRHHRHPQTDRL